MEWHPGKNNGLSPNEVTSGSNRKVWWLCRANHEWEATINHRSHGRGCPYCAGKLVLPGQNDLASTFPVIASEWHPEGNGALTPDKVMKSSHFRAVWICRYTHEWTAPVYSRIAGSGCPTCAGQKVLSGFNDLGTSHPELIDEWHQSKNEKLTVESLSSGSNVKVWWSCKRGHEWVASPNSRCNRGTGCPVCAGLRVEPGFNDLATTHPSISQEWHPILNEGILPNQVIAGSDRKYWWRCSQGHEWSANLSNRTKGSGCPICVGQAVASGVNDLQTTNPELVREWHPTKNRSKRPTDVVAGTHQRIWWQCSSGHEWQAAGSTRLSGRGCPICSGRIVWPGHTDMATTHPFLAREWHPTKNGALTPERISAGSGTKVWWLCSSGHEWRTMANNRARGSGCPACANYGFDASSPAYLYFLRSLEFGARKIGIANQGSSRIDHFASGGWDVIHVEARNDGHVVASVERTVLNWIRKELLLPAFLGRSEMSTTGGWTETFSIDGPDDLTILKKIETTFQLHDELPDQANSEGD
jgi:hypothetical protein